MKRNEMNVSETEARIFFCSTFFPVARYGMKKIERITYSTQINYNDLRVAGVGVGVGAWLLSLRIRRMIYGLCFELKLN